MKVALLAAGAAGMVCGSCLRDNRLAATLRAQGRDVTLIPLYTPIRTDEIDVSEKSVYFGGVNVYLQQKSVVFRWLPRFLDRLLDGPWLLGRLRGAGRMRAAELGALTVSVLRGEHGLQRKEVERLADALAPRRFDVINLPNLMFVGAARRLRERLGVTVACTLSGEDIFIDQLPEPHRGEALRLIRAGAEHVDGFIALTRYYADHCSAHFGLPRERLHVAPMGVRVEDFEDVTVERVAMPQTALGAAPEFAIGYMARICREKGLHQLVEAFIALHRAGRACRLRVAGWLGEADRAYYETQQRLVAEAGLAARVDWLGEVSRAEKAALLRSIHALCVPTVYAEAKGLYVLEALAAGVPVIAPRHGSFPELVDETGGGLLFQPGDVAGLSECMRTLMERPDLRAKLGLDGRTAVQARFTDAHMGQTTWAVLERVHAGRSR